MIVISRRENEALVIGDDLLVTVLEILPNRIRLGIRSRNLAPSYREETIYLTQDEEDHPELEPLEMLEA